MGRPMKELFITQFSTLAATPDRDLATPALMIARLECPSLNPAPLNAATLELRELAGAAAALGLQLQSLPVREAYDLAPAFVVMQQEQAEALLTVANPSLTEWQDQLVALAQQTRLPALYPAREQVAAGGLLSYGADVPDLYRRAAWYVDKVLTGTPPAEVPVEQPTRFELVVNRTTAQALGLTIPPAVLAQASEVIQ